MDLKILNTLIKNYNNKIKPDIENKNYSEAKEDLTCILILLKEEDIRNRMTHNPVNHLSNSIGSIETLINFIDNKKDDYSLINSAMKYANLYLNQYKMRLESIANKH